MGEIIISKTWERERTGRVIGVKPISVSLRMKAASKPLRSFLKAPHESTSDECAKVAFSLLKALHPSRVIISSINGGKDPSKWPLSIDDLRQDGWTIGEAVYIEATNEFPEGIKKLILSAMQEECAVKLTIVSPEGLSATSTIGRGKKFVLSGPPDFISSAYLNEAQDSVSFVFLSLVD